jgi:hypothetical protein
MLGYRTKTGAKYKMMVAKYMKLNYDREIQELINP